MNKIVYPAMLFIILMAIIIYLASIGTGMAILVPIIIVAIISVLQAYFTQKREVQM